MTARQTAFDALKRVDGGSYSTIILDSILEEAGLSAQDSALAAAIFYGTLENELLLDYIIRRQLKNPEQKLKKSVRIVLRMGIFQLAFMDKIPDNAAVDESVKLAKANGLVKVSGFINAMLRSFIRNGKQMCLPDREKEPIRYLSLRYSAPEWLVEMLSDDYGTQVCENALAASLGRPPVFIRINTTLCDIASLGEKLSQYGVKLKAITDIDGAAQIINMGDCEKLTPFAEGLFHVQDLSSQLCCKIVAPAAGERILDVCAAPGGKSFTLSEISGGKAEIIACDLYKQRADLIRSGAERLRLENITALCRDALDPTDEIIADRVLCDVPCSGLGVIRRKPDIKSKLPEDIDALPELQYKILERSARCVKPGGVLIYSTCTMRRAENDRVVNRFLKENNSFEPMHFDLPAGFSRLDGEPKHMLTVIPRQDSGDGFFIAGLRRKS